MKLSSPQVVTVAAILAGVVCTSAANAQEVTPRRDRTSVTGPNSTLLRSGVWTLGLSYVPALVTAINNSESYDKKLYIPVAGPWLDYGTRDCRTCNHETLNKALLITDGIFQGIGALQIVGSFLFLETRTTSVAKLDPKLAKAPRFQIAPTRLGAEAYGLTARGSF